MIGLLLLLVVVLLILGAIPAWPHSKQWGFAPTGILTVVLVAVLFCVLTGRL